MSSPKGTKPSKLRASLRARTREKFKKMRDENRSAANKSSYRSYCTLTDVRRSVRQTLANVKSAVENISDRCLRERGQNSYRTAASSPLSSPTPVKLYTPFGIETPSPPHTRRPPCRRVVTEAPGNRLKEDLQEIAEGMKELSAIADRFKSK